MKCRIMRHFIWVFTVYQSTHTRVSNELRVKGPAKSASENRLLKSSVAKFTNIIDFSKYRSNNVDPDQNLRNTKSVQAKNKTNSYQVLCKHNKCMHMLAHKGFMLVRLKHFSFPESH